MAQGPFPGISAFAIGNVNQAGDPAHQAGLVVVQLAVGVAHLPEHLHQPNPLLVIEVLVHHPGETEQLTRSLSLDLPRLEQLRRLSGLQAETLAQQLQDALPFDLVEAVVQARRLDQELLVPAWDRAARAGSGASGGVP